MVFNVAEADTPVSRGDGGVDIHGRASLRYAEVRAVHAVAVTAGDEPVALAHELFVFLFRVGAVAAERKCHGDVLRPDARGEQLFQYRRKHFPCRAGAGDIARDDGDRLARADGLAQGCGADGLAQRAAHLIRAGELIFERVCLQHGKNIFLRQRYALHAAAETKVYVHFAPLSRRNGTYSIPHGLPGVYIISRAERFMMMEKFVCIRLLSGSNMSLWRQMLSVAPTWSRRIS